MLFTLSFKSVMELSEIVATMVKIYFPTYFVVLSNFFLFRYCCWPHTGESNVYTLGNIGAHRIVSTKLPAVGSTRESMTASGNTTTRLLGTFQKVDYVFIIGVAGGVPHYTDFKKHVRLGDVVVSHVDQNRLVKYVFYTFVWFHF